MQTSRCFQRYSGQVISMVMLSAMVIALTGCDRTVLDAPSGQEVLSWSVPYDKQAAAAVMPFYRNADLTDYTFSLLLMVQNFNTSGVAVTLEVNGQSFERRYIAAQTQEVFQVTPDMVLATEAALGLSSTAAEPRLQGRPCPFVVRLKQYVAEDEYVIQNTNIVLAPQNFFETRSTEENFPYDENFTLDAHLVCPGAFALVLKQSHVDVIELDREVIGVNDTGDDQDTVIGVDSDAVKNILYQYHQATLDALTKLNMSWLVNSGDAQLSQ